MIHRLKNLYTHIINFVQKHVLFCALAGGVLLGIFVGSFLFLSNAGDPSLTREELHTVEVATIAQLNDGSPILLSVGTLRSASEATVRTQSSGQVTSINYKLGDFVPAGTVIASLENQSQRAAVAQARANLMQTESAALRENVNSEQGAWETYERAYLDAYDAITNQTETFFEDDRTGVPKLLIPSSGDTTLVKDRYEVTKRLKAWQTQTLSSPATAQALVAYLEQARNDLAFMESFLSRLGSAINKQKTGSDLSAEDLEAQRDLIIAAQSGIQSAQSSVTTAQNDLQGSLLGGGSGEADAQIASAQANLSSALAALEKTLIRAPISGSVSALNLRLGDFANSGIAAVTLTNPGTYEIVSYVTEQDARFISVGSPVRIDDTYTGTITSVAPGVNPETKKVEFRVGITDDAPALVSGSTVSLTIQSSTAPEASFVQNVTIPLTALKLTSEGSYLFTVDDAMTLIARPVEIERILGDRVTLKGEIERTLRIVVDARGLKAGEKVNLSN